MLINVGWISKPDYFSIIAKQFSRFCAIPCDWFFKLNKIMLHRKKSKKMWAIFCPFWSALDRKDVVQQIKPALPKACDLVWKWWMPCSISFLPFLSWYIRERADHRSQVHQEHRPLSMLIPKCHIDGWKMSYSKMSYEQNTYFLCWTYTTDGKPRLGHWTWHNKKNSVKLSCFCLNATGLKMRLCKKKWILCK